jgi:hypothetical protein
VEKKLKFVRMAALLGAVGGASVFLGLGGTAASAGEQRLHAEFKATYGLLPLAEGSGGNRADASKSFKTANASTSRPKKGNEQPDEPKIEDPPLPGFDGDNGDGTQSTSSSASKSRGKNG